MPTRISVVNGMSQSAGSPQRGQPAFPGPVGRAAVRGQVRPQRLDHHPLAGRDRPQPGQLVAGDRPGIGVREQPGLGQHPIGNRDQISQPAQIQHARFHSRPFKR